ncbi:MAG: hypothetical protein KF824_04930 [Fimbriimonadaceae bacterium]|nr:MAG: hypothetical protein KF824_04930 [Fimbriimonadaceae bacterium]
MAWSCRGKGELENAAKTFEQVMQADPAMIDQLQTPEMRKNLGDALYKKLFGEFGTPEAPRVEGWRADLAFCMKTLQNSHYNINAKTSEEKWNSIFHNLNDSIPNLTDKEVQFEFMKLVALAGDGHTCTWPILNPANKYTMLPAVIYPFKDGYFIRSAAQEYESIIGSKVTRIGSMTIEDVANAITPYVGHENPMHALWNSPLLMGTIEILKAIGATNTLDTVNLTIEGEGKTKTITMKTIPLNRSLYGDRDEGSIWKKMNSGATNPTPLYTKKPDDPYWFEYLEDDKILYFHYGNVFSKESEPFGDFVNRMFAVVDSKPVEAMVIDLRDNFGGSSELYKPLIKKLIQHPKISSKGYLFTLIGRSTYSAAINLAVDLEYWTDTLFIGEPTGCSPNFIGENKLFTLPYSGLKVSVSDRYHQHGRSDSTDKRIWIAPNIPAEFTSEDIRNNRDPGMKAVIDYLDYRG